VSGHETATCSPRLLGLISVLCKKVFTSHLHWYWTGVTAMMATITRMHDIIINSCN